MCNVRAMLITDHFTVFGNVPQIIQYNLTNVYHLSDLKSKGMEEYFKKEFALGFSPKKPHMSSFGTMKDSGLKLPTDYEG